MQIAFSDEAEQSMRTDTAHVQHHVPGGSLENNTFESLMCLTAAHIDKLAPGWQSKQQ